MRMSDWSSDVGSSDLPGSAAAAAGIVAGDRIVSLNGREMSTFDDIRLFAQIRPGEPVTILIDRQGRLFEKQGRVGAVEEDDGFGNKRSEEHTSELQSLMRISYAVFCLKKKQIKKTNTECISAH